MAPRYSTEAAKPIVNIEATIVCCTVVASRSRPISGNATFAIDRLMFATNAPKINVVNAIAAWGGEMLGACAGSAAAVPTGGPPESQPCWLVERCQQMSSH